MKYTKGQWLVYSQKFVEEPKEIVSGIGITNDGQYWEMICDMIIPDTDDEYIKQHEEIKANARLMSAAPELAESLRVAIVAIELEYSNYKNHPMLDMCKDLRKIYKKAIHG